MGRIEIVHKVDELKNQGSRPWAPCFHLISLKARSSVLWGHSSRAIKL
jgi:hypothetical protein